MIKGLAQKIAITMGTQLQVDRDRIEIFTYGLEIMLGALIQLTFLILISIVMGTFATTVIVMLAFASLRYYGGGVHLSTYHGCLIFGTTLLLAMGKLAETINLTVELLTSITVLTLLAGAFTILRWAPAGTEKKQIQEEKVKQRQRKKALLILIAWSVIALLLIVQKLNANALAAVLGILGSLFLITPWGYRAIDALDNILNIIWKGVVDKCLEK